MKTTLEIPDDLFRQAKAKAALEGRKLKDLVAESLRRALAGSPRSERGLAIKRKAQVNSLDMGRTKGHLALTNEIIAEMDDEDMVRGAYGGHYRLRSAPVKVSEGNEIRPLTNAEIAGLFEREEETISR